MPRPSGPCSIRHSRRCCIFVAGFRSRQDRLGHAGGEPADTTADVRTQLLLMNSENSVVVSSGNSVLLENLAMGNARHGT